ncbi:hypothetical protein SBY92_005285 [Candida maltosa Xu316]|uniref:Uncharacterized protein n=1 Tax=Candida maltosa (strain Xu316) TaxID=1245528 RepID=M3J488_CANMX|nr:hypothetical protein G210_2936 [Candida maltosa Xu316]
MSELKLSLPEIPASPELIPVFTFNLKLAGDPASIYVNNEADKSLNLATIANGEVKTVPNKLGLELDITSIYGTDDLNIKNSVATASLDCKLYGKTANGSGVFIYYPGKVQLNDASVAVISKQSQEATIADSYVTCNPTFHFDDKVEDKYKWVLKENLFGRGRFGRDADGVLYVQYYVYVVR